MKEIKSPHLADTVVELRPETGVQEQESREPRITQAHELVAQGAHASQATKVIQTVREGDKK
jgi:hypothetical protein